MVSVDTPSPYCTSFTFDHQFTRRSRSQSVVYFVMLELWIPDQNVSDAKVDIES
jgi:hypothetical protein